MPDDQEIQRLANEAEIMSNLPTESCAHCMAEPVEYTIMFRSISQMNVDRYLGKICAEKILGWI